MGFEAHLIYAALWASFGVLHSILAARMVKGWLRPLFGPAYRLAYNIFALVHIGANLIAGRMFLADTVLNFAWPDPVQYALWAVQGIGAAILLLALRQYDLGLFAGTKQLRDPESEKRVEPLNRHGLNALVRHPIYLGAHLLLWGGVGDDFTLATALWGSAYLIVGARFEERRLEALYGDAYRAYKTQAKFLIPWVW